MFRHRPGSGGAGRPGTDTASAQEKATSASAGDCPHTTAHQASETPQPSHRPNVAPERTGMATGAPAAAAATGSSAATQAAARIVAARRRARDNALRLDREHRAFSRIWAARFGTLPVQCSQSAVH